ncbi:MAG: hypothetical protein GY810_03475 [Aureispira sp.]|nr:hypothetical protein [Aureispira sp.]
MSEEQFYKWRDVQKNRLRKVKEDAEPVFMIVRESRKVYHVYGRYTSHDNYMGHAVPENLLDFRDYLKGKSIAYTIHDEVEGKKGKCYMAMNAYIRLEKKEFDRI